MLKSAAKFLRIEAKASPSVAPDATDSESVSWLEAIFGAQRGIAGISVTPDSAMKCPTAYACVAVLAQAVAQLPLHIYERTAEGGKERATGHVLHALLGDQPNDWTSAYEFRQAMMSSALRYDQGAFAWIGRVGGEIQELVQIPSASVAVETDPYTRVGVGGITFTGTNKIEFVLEDSYDGTAWAPVPASQVVGPDLTADDGIVLALKTAQAAAKVTKLGYIGDARYIRLKGDFSGTHGTGTPLAAEVIFGRPAQYPVD